MKAAFIERTGAPEEIRFGELPLPTVGPRDVLVKVKAVAVNPVDTYIRSGKVPMALPFPFIIGRDMAGVVQAVGPSVTRFSPEERVWCNNQGIHGRQGTFAEYVSIDEQHLYAMPHGADDVQVVAFVHSGLTAYVGLKKAGLRAGESLFINGGAGNVGSAALQLAKARGAWVFATAGSAEGLAWCRSLGADAWADYRTENVDAALRNSVPGGVNVYWDTSGNPDFDAAVGRLASNGRIVLMAGSGAHPPFPVGPFYTKGCSMLGYAVTWLNAAELEEAASKINEWAASGQMRVRISRVLPLSEAATAHRLVEERAPLNGKIGLTP